MGGRDHLEFFIMVGLIALIMGIMLFPVFRDANRATTTKHCMANIKVLSQASSMYAEDHEGLMERDKWMDALVPYLEHHEVLHCPVVKEESKEDPRLYGYAFNSDLSLVDPKGVANPAKVPFLYDSLNLARNTSDPFLSLPNPGRHPGGEHGRNVVAYLDGHVRAVPVGSGP